MSANITPIDIVGPPTTISSGTVAAAAITPWIQWIGLIASVVGAVWGLISIIKALYQFTLWINKTALPWYRSKYQNKSK